jgi:molybdopterin-synthase adenylyltransferase
MNPPRITLLKSHAAKLETWLTGHPAGHERGALVLFRRLSRSVPDLPHSDRFLGVDVLEMTDEWILESSKTHFTIDMRKLPPIYLRCELEDLELGFVHNHPSDYREFSSMDDVNEKNILYGISGCNSPASFLISLLLVNGEWKARVRQGINPDQVVPIRHISILGESIELHGLLRPTDSTEALLRQEAAFGKPFNAMMKSLRVAVVGLGGTGSPTATLLARCGVGELILIDGDDLETTNMNRVRGYRATDIGKKKAVRLGKYIESLGLETKVTVIPNYVEDSGAALDAISSADIVFGCTDDAEGRDILNQAMYYYLLAFIDLGIAGFVDQDSQGVPYLRDQRGRVSCILPEYGSCLRCQRVITEEMLKYERAIKERPELLALDPATLEREFYLRGGRENSPGIGPFTSATADNAVATLMNLVKKFRDLPDDIRQDNVWIDFRHLNIHSNLPLDNPDCIHCGKRTLLAKRERKYRLETPGLGMVENA